jgi:hypothetical protein
MNALLVTIPVEKIGDWESFHDVFQRVLGFPESYGRNIDAWIDYMTSVDSPEDGLSAVTVEPNQILVLKIEDPFEFKKRCPEQFDAIMEGSAFVNFRRTEIGKAPVLALLLNGRYEPRTS